MLVSTNHWTDEVMRKILTPRLAWGVLSIHSRCQQSGIKRPHTDSPAMYSGLHQVMWGRNKK